MNTSGSNWSSKQPKSGTAASDTVNPMAIKLQRDGRGNVIVRPVTDYEVRPVGDMSLMVAIEYVESPEQFENGERKTLQTLMYADQALEFAESIKRSVLIQQASKSRKV